MSSKGDARSEVEPVLLMARHGKVAVVTLNRPAAGGWSTTSFQRLCCWPKPWGWRRLLPATIRRSSADTKA